CTILPRPSSTSPTLSLHDALPIFLPPGNSEGQPAGRAPRRADGTGSSAAAVRHRRRCVHFTGKTFWLTSRANSARRVRAGARLSSEEHTSELQSRENLVRRPLLQK